MMYPLFPVQQACKFGHESYFCGSRLPQGDVEVTLPLGPEPAGWSPGHWPANFQQVLPPKHFHGAKARAAKDTMGPFP